jgi:flagellar motor switch protein FliN
MMNDALEISAQDGYPQQSGTGMDAEDTPVKAGVRGILSETEMDTLGEMGNICMGTSATTLNKLIGRRVSITTPKVSVLSSTETLKDYRKPYISIKVSYTEGIDGFNVLLMKQEDAALITDLLMGGDGSSEPDQALSDFHLSAISEVMNQMMGSSSTALSNMLQKPISISPPAVRVITLTDTDMHDIIGTDATVIRISFTMEIEGLLVSEIMQILPVGFGKETAGVLSEKPIKNEDAGLSRKEQKPGDPAPRPLAGNEEKKKINVKSVQYQSFEDERTRAKAESKTTETPEPMELIIDIPLQVTVELGKARKSIKDVMGMTVGSLVVLNRLAGELVDVLVNGKLIARGEVVVIDESYGVRITEIVSASRKTGTE